MTITRTSTGLASEETLRRGGRAILAGDQLTGGGKGIGFVATHGLAPCTLPFFSFVTLLSYPFPFPGTSPANLRPH